MKYIYDQFGIRRRVSDLNAVERLFALKGKSSSNPWPVIEECVKIWEATNPTEYKSFLFELEDIKQTRRDKFASSDPKKDTKYGGQFRYTLDIPEKVMYMLRCVYDTDELPMNREFFMAWSKRFPKMKVAEKI